MIEQKQMTANTIPAAGRAGPFREGSGEEDVYDDGCLRVEHDNYYVVCRGGRMQFTRVEFLLLSRLVRQPDRVVENEELWRHVWGEARPYNPGSLHVHMYRLRRRFSSFRIRVESMPHVGYRISLDECCRG